jgi:hypothetical protein
MRPGEPIAALGGMLLLVSEFLPWYAGVTAEPVDVSGFDALTVIDMVLVLLAMLAILVPISSLASSGPAKAVGVAVLASAFGWIAIVLVGFRIVDVPSDYSELRFGAWLALAGAVIAWVGSWLSLRDESTPGAVASDVPLRPSPHA